jgi:hypothetical protein
MNQYGASAGLSARPLMSVTLVGDRKPFAKEKLLRTFLLRGAKVLDNNNNEYFFIMCNNPSALSMYCSILALSLFLSLLRSCRAVLLSL